MQRDLDGPGPLPIQWERRHSNGLPGATFTCYHETDDGSTTTQISGVGWVVIMTNTETGEMIFVDFACEYPGDDPPQPPPAPPTPERIAEGEAALLELDSGFSPPASASGVSQLDTWIWCEYDGPVDLAVSLPPYQVDASVAPTQLRWTIDGPDGTTTLEAQQCGSRPPADSDGESAAAQWTPNEPGRSTIDLTSSWSGIWTVTLDLPPFGPVLLGTFDLGTVDIDSPPVGYSVVEIQTVGTRG